ncbi:unnamed protein product [Symbiodinium sp. KB8]|nr:unnamed protein product [Symbiodinium sp. KB8]
MRHPELQQRLHAAEALEDHSDNAGEVCRPSLLGSLCFGCMLELPSFGMTLSPAFYRLYVRHGYIASEHIQVCICSLWVRTHICTHTFTCVYIRI